MSRDDRDRQRLTAEWNRELRAIQIGEHAAAYLRRGWYPIPLWWVREPGICACPKGADCRSAGKHPLTRHGSREPLTTQTDVEIWWERHPYANVGIATGATSKLLVLDVDPGHGGLDSIRKIIKKYGGFPKTPMVVTGSDGRHVYYEYPENGDDIKNVVGFMSGLDVRATGGLVVAPPSLHSCGNRYLWHKDSHPQKCKLAKSPPWLKEMCDLDRRHYRKIHAALHKSRMKKEFDVTELPAIMTGNRNNTLISLVGRLIWEDRGFEEVRGIAHEINLRRCDPPMSTIELDHLVDQAYKRWA